MQGNKRIKFTFAIIFIAILFLLGACLFSGGLIHNELSVLKANWGVNLPQPLKIINVASDRGGMSDGTTYNIFEYSDQTINELKKLNYWASAGTIITSAVKRSIAELEESEEVPHASKELLKKYPPALNDSCSYYYQNKGEFEYLIMILDVSDKKVYVLESYM